MAAEDWRRLPQSKPENLLEALRSLTDPETVVTAGTVSAQSSTSLPSGGSVA